MASKFICRLLLIAGVLGLVPALALGRQIPAPCDAATVSPSSLRCAFDTRPMAPALLTSGQLYVSGTDLTKTPYPTFLYANGNSMPAAHRAAGNAIAANLQPLDANGKVDLVNGKIVAIAEGMSNTLQQMYALEQQFIKGNPAINPKFQFFNLAEGGCNLICWVDKGVGAIDPQVQIVFMKHSNNFPQMPDGTPVNPRAPFTTSASKRFPNHAQVTQGMFKQRILDLKIKYPNLKLLFITSRTYGGWTCNPAGVQYREPVAYEEGFSVKWLLDGQISGSDLDLNFAGPNAKAPWMAWGPYLWDPSWPQDWFEGDGTHPCLNATPFVAKKWHDFLMADSAAWPWFRDNVKPTAPANLSAKIAAAGQINLSWNAASDNSGNVKYRLLRNGVLLRTTTGLSYSDTGLKTGTPYCYTVSAVDSAGNESAPSNQACATIVPTGIFENSPLPLAFALFQNHPNPLRVETEIRFQLQKASWVEVKIYNAFGEEIRALINTFYSPGNYSVRWDGKNVQGNQVVNGVYFCQLRAGSFSQVRKMTLLR